MYEKVKIEWQGMQLSREAINGLDNKVVSELIAQNERKYNQTLWCMVGGAALSVVGGVISYEATKELIPTVLSLVGGLLPTAIGSVVERNLMKKKKELDLIECIKTNDMSSTSFLDTAYKYNEMRLQHRI